MEESIRLESLIRLRKVFGCMAQQAHVYWKCVTHMSGGWRSGMGRPMILAT
jgi:hypothetical protein